jgi:hypothetical protein
MSAGTITFEMPWRQVAPSTAASEELTSREYVITWDQIEELRREEEQEDRPSDIAYQRALTILRQAARQLGRNFPQAIVATGPDRSLRLLWSCGRREVRLVIGGTPANKTYFYRESAGHHEVDYIVNGTKLAGYLRWVLAAI